MTLEIIGLVVLAAVCGVFVWRILNQPPTAATPPATPPPAPAVRAKKDLAAFKQLEGADLDVSTFKTEEQTAALAKYVGRRLLTAVKKGDAVTDAAVATKAASAFLDNPLTASIPATPAMTLGGRLKVGDVVALASVASARDAGGGAAAQVNRAENLVVLGLPAEALPAATKGEAGAAPPPGAIVVAMKQDNLDAFVSVLGGTSLTLIRPTAGAD